MKPDEKEALVASVPFWWHSMDFGDGVLSKGQNTLDNQKVILSHIPEDLRGKTVLDIGAWDGFYSFECEKKGARVTAIDNNQHMRGHNGFDVAKLILDSKVEHYEMDFFDVTEKLKKEFDVVLFLGVLYHLKDPLRALEALSIITREVLIIESHYVEYGDEIPLMRFYPGTELNNDPTNWWGPNIPALISMLKVAGFRCVDVVNQSLSGTDHDRAILRAYKHASPITRQKVQSHRQQMHNNRKEYRLAELLETRDRIFIRDVYRSLLKRDPDPVGMDYFLTNLRNGVMSPADMVRFISSSEEGKNMDVKVVDL